MEFAVKQFARKILILHLLLLVGVFAMVLLASRAIREGARDQAIKQAERRQRMLANQTARGIEAFYRSITSDMDLVPREDDTESERGKLGSLLREMSREINIPLLGPPPSTQPGESSVNRLLFPPGAFGDRQGRPNGQGGFDRSGGPDHPGGSGLSGGGPTSDSHPGSANNAGGPQQGPRPTQGAVGNRAFGGGNPGGGGGGGNPGGPNGGRPRVGRSLLVGQILGRQLEERVTHLFVVNRPPEPPVPTKAAAKVAAATTAVRRAHGLVLGDVIVKPKEAEALKAEVLVERFHDWMLAVREQSVSRFELFSVPVKQDDGSVRTETRGFNLVAMPVGGGPGGGGAGGGGGGGGGGNGRNSILVAAIPVSTITEQFLSALNEDSDTGVMLVNNDLTIMAASRSAIVGANIATVGDADLRGSLDAFKAAGFQGTDTIEHAFMVGGETFDPSLLTAEPIKVNGRVWFLVVGSPLREVDAYVAQLFGKIFVWAVVVVVLVTGILVSTSITMIRSRVRLERVRHESITKELDRARQIQRAWLPAAAPSCRTVDLAAVNFPANHISGDFYNWFELPDGRIAVVIGDVTGHGMSAAFLMATTQLLVRTTMQRMTDPAACLEEVNRQLCTLVFNEQFVTLQILVLDPDGGPVEVASAGHPAPLLADHGRFLPLDAESGLVLGVEPDVEYQTHRVELPAGASLLLYTDGAIDVLAPNGTRLGTDGLLGICPPKLSPGGTADRGRAAKPHPTGDPLAALAADADHDGRPLPNGKSMMDAKAMLDAVVASVNHFRGSRELSDDLTFVAVRLTRSAPAATPELVGAV